MFNLNHELNIQNGRVYIDRNQEVFGLVLDYLRDNQKKFVVKDDRLKQQFDNELKYWGL
jgi:hypothetical protein